MIDISFENENMFTNSHPHDVNGIVPRWSHQTTTILQDT